MPGQEKSNVLIIGGGLAGLTAAVTLKERGLNVLVLEADNRLGGRVKTEEIDGQYVEMGGESIGAEHLDTQSLCRGLNIPLVSYRFSTCLKINPHQAIENELPKNYTQKMITLKVGASDLLLTQAEYLANTSWQDFLIERGFDDEEIAIENIIRRLSYSRYISALSAFNLLHDLVNGVVDKEDGFWIEGGNSRLINCLGDTLGENAIRLNSKVEVIKQSKVVEVRLSDGLAFNADVAVVALPPYQVMGIDWLPTLPREKVEALTSVSYAHVTKVASEFPNKFWDDNFEILQDGNPNAIWAPVGQASKKGVLIAYGIGKNATELIRLDEGSRKRVIMDLLYEKFDRIPHISQTLIAHWEQAYSVYRYKPFEVAREVISKPWLNVYFAGEHIPTDFSKQGYMEGAVSSGLEVAKLIVKNLTAQPV